ncbi:MAG: TonB-dependent receptor [Chitinophagales bacterium]|nr:TonB-dependent receptor [Chitinophagales bacterium]
MRIILKSMLILFVAGFSLSMQAQDNHVKGKVTDTYNQALTGVSVSSSNGVVYTDERGYFNLNLDSGVNTLLFKYLGMQDSTIVVTAMPGGVNLGTIKMKESGTILKEINVTTTPLMYKENYQGSNYYVSPVTLKHMQPISTEEALKVLPGVNVLGDLGLSNRLNVSIRGSWGRRSEKILMMEDGAPISPAPYTAPGIYYNPISDRVSGIEVITGADLLRYGPNNMFGVINYNTPKPPQKPTVRAKLTGGQRGYMSGLLSYGGTWNKVGAQIEGVYKQFNGFTQNSSVKDFNINAKIFAELTSTQSLFFKISGQFEDNQATLSSITPYTFNIDPTQSPFDADRFLMHRYSLDIIHKYTPEENASFTTRLFTSDFARDWWRQTNTVIKAKDVRGYVGESIFSEKYKYLEGHTPTDDDYVRVGTIKNGREGTTDSRWNFSVVSLDETFEHNASGDNWLNKFEVQGKFYRETFIDRVLEADSTKWARTGRFTTDIEYALVSLNGYVRNQFTINNFDITPIFRLERVWMDKTDNIVNAKNPNLTSDEGNERVNNYTIFQPGVTLGYRFGDAKVFGSVYKGYIAPSKYYGFWVERDGNLVAPVSPEDLSNIKPEVSLNAELGIRGELLKNLIWGQIAVYNNRITNFSLAGWSEYFSKLAEINIQGAEIALRIQVLPEDNKHRLAIRPNLTLLNSKVLSGELQDLHLFTQIKHTQATKQEMADKANANPNGYAFYVKNAEGQEVQLQTPISPDDLTNVVKTVYKFGNGGIEDGVTPYTPKVAYNIGLDYGYGDFNFGFSYNYVGDQYGEYANFTNVSGDGGLGQVKAFTTFDVNASYDFNLGSTRCNVFVAGKNLGDNVVVGSRLNRGQSGIMAVGFRQVNAGLILDF